MIEICKFGSYLLKNTNIEICYKDYKMNAFFKCAYQTFLSAPLMHYQCH